MPAPNAVGIVARSVEEKEMKRGRRPWTAVEEETLLRGIKKVSIFR